MGTSFFAVAARGLADLLAAELQALGLQAGKPEPAGVPFTGDLADAYTACLRSRLASRVLLPIARFDAPTPEALYEGARGVPWHEHLAPDGSLMVSVAQRHAHLGHTQYAAQVLKDAVVDALRTPAGVRPSVDREAPDVRLHLWLEHASATVSIDLAGEALHRRGWRAEAAEAPLKETLAAAVLLRSRFPEAVARGETLIDPMCGSGTLVIEAALMAADLSPGRLRRRWGFETWRGHDEAAWRRVCEVDRARPVLPAPLLWGFDVDPGAVAVAQRNAARAGVEGRVRFATRALAEAAPPEGAGAGMVVTNPPYGERLGDAAQLVPLYRELGQVLKARFGGFSAHVLTSEDALASAIGLRKSAVNAFWNGAIPVRLWHYKITAARSAPAAGPRTPGAFQNRLVKNLRTVGRWAEKEGIACYRLYDADIPEYAVAVDVYERWAHVQEYAPPKDIDPAAAKRRLHEVLESVPQALGIPASDVFAKTRRRQKDGAQYEKLSRTGRFFPVHESGHVFMVNFEDYLDTGLFLDHRLTRRLVGELAAGKDFLNLFAYTGTASVYAAKGGARSTTTVDLSNTYLDWAERNLEANDLRAGAQHRLERADALSFLEGERRRFGLIFVDPPTHSRSKSAPEFDVQRDQGELLKLCLARLAPGGVIVFSTNFQRFKLEALAGGRVEEITEATVPKDFARRRPHRVWRIEG